MREEVQALLRFAAGACILGVHVEAVGAAIDLRDTRPHEFEQAMVESATARVALEGRHRLVGLGRGRPEIESFAHHVVLCIASLGVTSTSHVARARMRWATRPSRYSPKLDCP